MKCTASKVIEIALSEVGYLEKASNSQLDDKTANAGSGNYTKYARDLDNLKDFYNYPKNGYAWCDIFVDWCLVQAFGREKGQSLLRQPNYSAGAGCYYSAQYYQAYNQFYKSNPRPGDQIFFRNFNHTGLVYKVDNTYVYTVEGNTSNADGVVANGGCVAKKRYYLTSSDIEGYGRPKYDVEDGDPVTPEPESDGYQPTVLEWQSAAINDGFEFPMYGADGEWGSECEAVATKAIVKDRGYEYLYPSLTRIVQQVVGVNVDGLCGPGTASAVVEYQRKNNLSADGEVGLDTWKRMLGITHNDVVEATPTPEEKPVEPEQNPEEAKPTESTPVTEEKETIVEPADNDKEHGLLHIILEFLKSLLKLFEKKN